MASAFRQAPRAFSSGFTAGSNREINIERLRLEAKRQRFSDSLSLRREERADEELELRRSQARQQRQEFDTRLFNSLDLDRFQDSLIGNLDAANALELEGDMDLVGSREVSQTVERFKEATGFNQRGHSQRQQLQSIIDSTLGRTFPPEFETKDGKQTLIRRGRRFQGRSQSRDQGSPADQSVSFGRSITEQEELEGLSNDDFARRLDAARNQQTEQPPPRQQRRIRGTSVHF